MRHIIYLPFLALLAAFGGDASDQSAKALEQQLGHLQNVAKISADFEQVRSVKEWGAEVKTSGSFEVSKKKPQRVLWQIKKPTTTAIKMEGQTLMIKTNGDSSAWTPLDNPKVVSQMQTIFAWLAMDTQQILKDFTVSRTSGGQFVLAPRDKKSLFQSIALRLNKKNLVEEIVMTENSDDRISLSFSNTRLSK